MVQADIRYWLEVLETRQVASMKWKEILLVDICLFFSVVGSDFLTSVRERKRSDLQHRLVMHTRGFRFSGGAGSPPAEQVVASDPATQIHGKRKGGRKALLL